MTYKLAPAEILNVIGLNIFGTLPLKQSDKPLILCYHSIDEHEKRYSVTPKTLEEHIKILLSMKRIITLEEMLTGTKESLKNTVALTFDDGYSTMVSDVMPIMFKYSIKPTLFIIGEHEYEKIQGLNKDQPLLSKKDILFLKNAGWEIGFHTKSHKNLTTLFIDDLKREVIENKKELENELGINFRYFSYPYGLVSNQVKDIVREAGFEAAVTTSCDTVKLDDKLALSRIPIEHTISPKLFRVLITQTGIIWQEWVLAIIKLKIAMLG
jgi:peptidoglycan/xylan/chitin deacetylase (PgdA/CDA1 family)